MPNDRSTSDTERETIPEECQLCRLLDYRGDDINEPEGMVEVARDDGGTKIVHSCERCAHELFRGGGGWTAYEGGDRDA